MSTIKKSLARKAVKSTAKHSARGTASKLKRDPIRAIALLGLGGLLGALAGWLLGRSAAQPAPAGTGA
ncbi:MAG TPA: hypothetical protein VFI17_06080 [Solirubrobacterales bacterium]|nr:hypothetical protein [Solirubrobacterales bacterium]